MLNREFTYELTCRFSRYVSKNVMRLTEHCIRRFDRLSGYPPCVITSWVKVRCLAFGVFSLKTRENFEMPCQKDIPSRRHWRACYFTWDSFPLWWGTDITESLRKSFLLPVLPSNEDSCMRLYVCGADHLTKTGCPLPRRTDYIAHTSITLSKNNVPGDIRKLPTAWWDFSFRCTHKFL